MGRKRKSNRLDAPSHSPSSVLPQETILSWLIASTFVILPLVFKPGIIAVSNEPKFLIASICVALCFISFGFVGIFGSGPIFLFLRHKAEDLCLIIGSTSLILLSALSFSWARNIPLGIEEWREWLVAYVVFIMIFAIIRSPQAQSRILGGLVIGGAMNSGLALLQLLFDAAPDFHRAPPGGSFLNRNFAASYAVLCLGPSIFLYLHSRKSSSRQLWMVTTLLLTLFIFHSFSRASWIAALCIWVLSIISGYLFAKDQPQHHHLRPPSTKTFLIFAVLLFGGTNIDRGGFSPRLLESFSRVQNAFEFETISKNQPTGVAIQPDNIRGQTTNSFKGRVEYWRNILELIDDNFVLGIGFGNLEVEFPPYNSIIYKTPFDTNERTLTRAHNEILEVTTEMGLLGLACLAFTLSAFYLTLIRRWKSDPTPLSFSFVTLSIAIGLTGFFVNCFASSPLDWPAHKFGFAVLLGLYIAAGPSFPKPLPPGRKVAGVILLCIGLFVIFYRLDSYRNVVRAETLYVKGANRVVKSVYDKDGLEMLLDAAQILPNDKLILRSTGGMLKIHGRHDLALEYMERVAHLFPFDFKNNQNLANLYLKLDRHEEAEATFDRIYQVVDDDIDSLLKLAVLKRKTNIPESNSILDRALSLKVTSPLAYILKAENAQREGRYRIAEEYLRKGYARFPKSKMILKAAADLKIELP